MLLVEKYEISFHRNRKKWLTGMLVLFGIIFGLISFVNHYLFRTSALDLGMFNQAVYQYAHFQKAMYTQSVTGEEVNYLGDHFSPITILYAPFMYLFGSYTLLIIQVLAVLFGAYGVYHYVFLSTERSSFALLATLMFFGMWGIYSAIAFDFHNNLVAAMLVPWLFIAYKKRNIQQLLSLSFFILISKENMALWLVFILIGLAISDKFNWYKSKPVFHTILVLTTIIYFVVVMKYIMPWFSEGRGLNQLGRYHLLGGSLEEIFTNVFTEPVKVFSLLFSNTTGEAMYDGIKAELYKTILFCGGLALLIRPVYILMLLPVLAQKVFSDDPSQWGVNYQYSVEFAPLLVFAAVEMCLLIEKKWKYGVAAMLLVMTITHFRNVSLLEKRVSTWYLPEKAVYYAKKHYKRKVNVSNVYEKLKLIPEEVVVSAGCYLSPHLSMRSKVYQFPVVKEAKYIAVLKEEGSLYPLTKETLPAELDKFKTSPEWQTVYEDQDLFISKRK